MFDNYSTTCAPKQSIHVNAVSGTIVKNYRKSFFKRFNLKSETAKTVFSSYDRQPYLNVYDNKAPYNCGERDVIVIQAMVCGDMEVLCELMWKEDFDELFNDDKWGNA